MTIRLDHTIVPAKDRKASAAFFAEIFGLKVKPGNGYFAQVQVNDALTLEFSDEPEDWGGPGFDPQANGHAGFGLAIVAAVADEWGVEQQPDGCTVWCALTAEAIAS